MNCLPPFKAFQIYNACFLHYTTSYDYHKSLGVTKATQEQFESRKDKGTFYNISKEWGDSIEYEYYIAWLFYAHDFWVGSNMIIEDQVRFMLEWDNYSKKRLYNFKLDLVKIYTVDPNVIFNKLRMGDIHYTTLLILNKYTNIISLMDKELAHDESWVTKSHKLKKFEPFYFAHEPIVGPLFVNSIPENLCRVF